jgi:hypothetical protein
MNRQYLVVVGGYIRGEVYGTIEKQLARVGSTEDSIHIYPYNSEGYQLHLVSNTVIPTEDVCNLISACNDMDGDNNMDTDICDETKTFYTSPMKINNSDWDIATGEYHYLGSIVGYDYEGMEIYEQ